MHRKTLFFLLSLGVTTSLFVFGATFLSHEVLAQGIESPIGDFSISDAIARVINILLGLVASVGLLFFVIGGIRLITSGGSNEKITSGKQTLFWATIGIILALGSYFILNFVIRAVTGQ